jgi:hypothetical protein
MKRGDILLAVDAYLEAMIDKTPGKIPASSNLKMTYNGERTEPGESLL